MAASTIIRMTCDGTLFKICNREEYVLAKSHKEARKEMEKEGWTQKKWDGKNVDLCALCVESHNRLVKAWKEGWRPE